MISELFGWCLFYLAREPELSAELRDHPKLISGFVEEVLRLEPVTPWADRTVAQPTTIAGVALPVGATVILCYGAVNRDGSDAMSSDDLVLSSRGHPHFSFGASERRCRGPHLVREAMRVFVEEWVARVPRVELAAGYRPVNARPNWWPDQLPLKFGCP